MNTQTRTQAQATTPAATPTCTPRDRASTAYATHAAQAAALHLQLGETLRAHQLATEAQPGTTWGRAGDMEHVAGQLSALLAFLGGKP